MKKLNTRKTMTACIDFEKDWLVTEFLDSLCRCNNNNAISKNMKPQIIF